MSPIRLGVIGLSTQGWAATGLIPPIFDPLLSSKYTLVALCTSSEPSALAAAAKFSGLAGRTVKPYHGEQGYHDIANDPEVDMVAVSVKMPDHFKAVMAAIEAGKDIFVEWSPGKNLEETTRIAEAARAKSIRSLVGAQGTHLAAVRNVKELIDSGRIGRVLSTSLLTTFPPELNFFGKTVTRSTAYGFDINNGTTLLTVPVAHFLVVLSNVLGDLTEVSASSHIRIPAATFIDASGNPTGETLMKTSPDQVTLTGTLGGKHSGVVLSVHCQAGVSDASSRFQWIVDGEEGSIEVRNRPEDGPFGAFIATNEKTVLLNGQEVIPDPREEDRLGTTGKAWLEFSKGTEGHYEDLEHALRIYRALDAAVESIRNGQAVHVK